MIDDQILKNRWIKIRRHCLNHKISVEEFKGLLECVTTNNLTFYITKHSTKFRLKSHIDWAWYEPKSLAQALTNNTLEQYYEIMLKDIHSDPNEWRDKDLEMTLKTHYAHRAGRCSLI